LLKNRDAVRDAYVSSLTAFARKAADSRAKSKKFCAGFDSVIVVYRLRGYTILREINALPIS